MQYRKLLFVPLFLSSLCQVSFAQDSAVDATVLNGNWHLTESVDSKVSNPIDLTLGVDGNTVYAEGSTPLYCENGHAANTGIALFLEGQVATDGSFVLTNRYPLAEIPIQTVFLRGNIPASGTAEWHAHFEILAFSKTGNHTDECPAISRNYIAMQFPSLSGAYEGVVRIAEGGNGETEATVSVDVTQGKLTTTPSARLLGHPILVTANVTISGSSCLPTGPLEPGKHRENDRISGGYFQAFFLQGESHNRLTLSGRFNPPDESRIRVTIIYSSKNEDGKSNIVTASGWLTRQ